VSTSIYDDLIRHLQHAEDYSGVLADKIRDVANELEAAASLQVHSELIATALEAANDLRELVTES